SAYNRLKGIGDWMKINSEAIYNSRKYTSFSDGDTIRYTQSKDGKTLYVFLFNNPGSVVALTKTVYQKNMKATLLGSKARLKLEKNTQGLSIIIPGNGTDHLKNVWVIKLTRE
ncbi:MAG TPA: alpha-L-fucosidase C-terminal domain-containing protein, partial [Ferruginibacter sp.]|nr:alpha-L-fucosidase C-terminal domain-containing protein [Ferruginibacter sp.]